MEQLSTFCRVLLFDKAGVGLSDPVPKVRTLDDRAAEIEAVVDAAGFGKARHLRYQRRRRGRHRLRGNRPQRTRALILTGTFPLTGAGSMSTNLPSSGARLSWYAPSTEQRPLGETSSRRPLGVGASVQHFAVSCRRCGRCTSSPCFRRMSPSPGMARATVEATFRIDVRSILPAITAPTLVIRSANAMPVQGGRYLADHIPGCADARGRRHDDHAPWFRDPDRITTEIKEVPHRQPCRAAAVTSCSARGVFHRHGRLNTTRRGDRRRAVGERCSTALARSQPNSSNDWRDGGEKHRRWLPHQRSTARHRPSAALRPCVQTSRRSASSYRAGIHARQNANCSTTTSGASPYTSRRGSSGRAGPGEILVSRAVRDLVVGSGTGFEDRGSVELRGVRHLATPGSQPPWPSGRIARGRTGVNAHPGPGPRCAAGPCRGGHGEAHAVDPAWDGWPRPGHRSQLNSLGYRAE